MKLHRNGPWDVLKFFVEYYEFQNRFLLTEFVWKTLQSENYVNFFYVSSLIFNVCKSLKNEFRKDKNTHVQHAADLLQINHEIKYRYKTNRSTTNHLEIHSIDDSVYYMQGQIMTF